MTLKFIHKGYGKMCACGCEREGLGNSWVNGNVKSSSQCCVSNNINLGL